MADPKLSADHTRSHSGCSHLDDLETDVVGEGAPVDEHPAQLVHTTLALEHMYGFMLGERTRSPGARKAPTFNWRSLKWVKTGKNIAATIFSAVLNACTPSQIDPSGAEEQ